MSAYKRKLIKNFVLNEDEIDNMSDKEVDNQLNKISKNNDNKVQDLEKEQDKQMKQKEKEENTENKSNNDDSDDNNSDDTVDDNTPSEDDNSTDNTEPDTSMDGFDDGSSDDTSNDEDIEKNKKIVLFKQYKDLLETLDNTIVSVNYIKDKEETLSQKENDTLAYIIKSLNDLKEKAEHLVFNSFLKMNYQKLLTLFINLHMSFMAIVKLVENLYSDEDMK